MSCFRVVPLRGGDGALRAVALVDEEDFAQVSRHRWRLHSEGYASRNTSVGGVVSCVLLHRQLLGLEHGDPREGDHKNRDRLDCRRENLRIVPPGANLQNMPARGVSRFRGVARARRGRWQAYAQIDGRRKALGEFDDEVTAALAAHAARCEHMPYALADPELVRLGLVDGLAVAA